MFIGLLASINNTSNHTKCVLFSNHKCMIYPNHINLNPNESPQGLNYYQFAVNLVRSVGSCNILNDLSK